jgi:hypothetical protein
MIRQKALGDAAFKSAKQQKLAASSDTDSDDSPVPSSSTGLRQRRGGKPLKSEPIPSSTTSSSSQATSIPQESPPPLDLSSHPLAWFGMTAPRPVGEAQQQFVEALSHISQLASLQMKLAKLQKQMEQLLPPDT